eukprot:Gregarina_sp_Poly_1__8464@NODE_499_length_7894_cov_59_656446_g399_i0_p5_GENE_NODE_499_length_7894_cov_59_656446_g399_i0NODE_499_length_7894_cov_59_656446_g399_i0_p5_ORF_typecomplete_len184_score10_44_NODE_499_length_7894_cov_59_656446_g399_i057646315
MSSSTSWVSLIFLRCRSIQTYRAFEKLLVLVFSLRARERCVLAQVLKSELENLLHKPSGCRVSCSSHRRGRRFRHRRHSSTETLPLEVANPTSSPFEELNRLHRVLEVLERDCRVKYTACYKSVCALISSALPYCALWTLRKFSADSLTPKLFAPTSSLSIAGTQPYLPWLPFLQKLLFFAPQ